MNTEPTTYKLFTQRTGLVGIVNLITGLRGLILLPILTKTLGAFGYGVWSQIIVTIFLIVPFATLGLGQAVTRFLTAGKDKEQIREGFLSIFSTVLFSGLVFSVVVFALSDIFASTIIKDVSIAPIIKIAAFAIVLQALNQIALSFIIASLYVKRYSILLILQTFIEVGLIAYMVLSGFGILGAVAALLISRAISLSIVLPYILSKIGFKFPNFSNLKAYLSFSLPMIFTGVFVWIIHSSDRYMIGYFMSSASVGIYSAAYGMGGVIPIFSNPIGIILFPTVSKLWDEGNVSEAKTHLRFSLKYFLMLAIPSAFGLSVLAKSLLLILSTSEFISGAILVPFVAFGMILYYTVNPFHYILTSVKRTNLIAISLGAASICNIVLNILLIPKIGILGAAIATLITYALVGIALPVLSFKYFRFKIDWAFIIKSIIASSIMASLIMIFSPTGLTSVIIAIIGGALVYFLLLFLSKSFSKDEIEVLKGALRTR